MTRAQMPGRFEPWSEDDEREMDGFLPPDADRTFHGPTREELARSKSWLVIVWALITIVAGCSWVARLYLDAQS